MSEKDSTTPTITEQEMRENPLLSMVVEEDSKLKTFLVTHVGTKFDKEEVTVQMIADVLALEFPEFAFSFAEENYIRGYEVGLDDALRSIQAEPQQQKSD